MLKRTFFLFIALSAAAAAFAAPTDEEVADSFTGVFGVYSAVFMNSLMGQTVPGTSVDMDMQTGNSSLEMDNVDAEVLFESLAAIVGDEGDMPALPFKTISGTFTTTAAGTMEMDVVLGGGPVKNLSMKAEGENLISLNADGKSYLHLEQMLEAMEP